MAQALLVCKEEKSRTAAYESPTRGHEVPHPLLARRHGQDPEVREAKVRLVDSPPPGLLVGEELAEKASLRESLPHNRHRTPVGFEEEEGAVPPLRFALEAQAEDPIRLHAQAVRLATVADLDLPAEGKA